MVALQQLGRCLKAGSDSKPVILDFVNNLSGRSVYEAMSREWMSQSVDRAPRTIKGFMEFRVTGFLSDILEQVNSMLAELDAWQENYEKLKQFYEKENHWPAARENLLGSWCSVQRRIYKKGELPAERVSLLDAIHFSWSTRA